MSVNHREIGERIRAYRIGSGLSPDEVAARLGISRAALYNYERGAILKIEIMERVAKLLDVSVPALLGVGTEYFSNAISYFERKRQIEDGSEQLVTSLEPISFLLASDDYVDHLRTMLVEGAQADQLNRKEALAQIDRIISVLMERRASVQLRRPAMVSLISAIQVERFLRTGLIGTYALSSKQLQHRRELARFEIERMAALMENEPMGVQIGIIEGPMPTQTFQLFRRREDTVVSLSPYRLGEFPNVTVGVASVTSAADAVGQYEHLAKALWARAHKGARGAELVREIIAAVWPGSPRVQLQQAAPPSGAGSVVEAERA